MNLDNYLFYNLCRNNNDDRNTIIKITSSKDEEIKKKKLETIKINSQKDESGSEIYYLESTNHDNRILDESYAFFDSSPWLFDLDRELTDNVRISITVVDLWINFNKFFSEDETVLLMLLNKFSKTYFKSKLSKIMIFHITQ